ncbi:MAG: hypothetical protein AAF547_18470 [Actinomycetota bacterium]
MTARLESLTLTEQTWRPHPSLKAAQIGGAITGGILGLLGVAVVIEGLLDRSGGQLAAGTCLLFAGLLPAVSFLRAAFRSRVVLSDHTLSVVNAWRSWTIEWTDVENAVPGYHGLAIYRRNGWPVTATAIQKSNWAVWTKTHTESDRLAREINKRAASAGRIVSPEKR